MLVKYLAVVLNPAQIETLKYNGQNLHYVIFTSNAQRKEQQQFSSNNCSLKLNNIGPSKYLDGWPLGIGQLVFFPKYYNKSFRA